MSYVMAGMGCVQGICLRGEHHAKMPNPNTIKGTTGLASCQDARTPGYDGGIGTPFRKDGCAGKTTQRDNRISPTTLVMVPISGVRLRNSPCGTVLASPLITRTFRKDSNLYTTVTEENAS